MYSYNYNYENLQIIVLGNMNPVSIDQIVL